MSRGRSDNSQVASSVPFDNTGTEFEAEDVQAAIEEIGNTASPPFSFGRSGNNASGTWLTRVGGAPSNRSGVNVPFIDSKVVKISSNSENLDTYDIGIYQHDGDSINLTLIATVSVVASRQESFDVSLPLTTGRQLAVRIVSGSAKNIGVDLTLTGKA